MAVDSNQQPMMSFKDKLLGVGLSYPDGYPIRNECDLVLQDGDVNMSMVNGIPTITFLDRIKDILFKEIESTVILKLLERNIGYNIRLPGLPGYLYKRQIIEAIGGVIGKVVKLDLQADNRTRGRFARLVVFINLDEPLTSKVLVDGVIQRVEYEALPTVCFSCGKYEHVKDLCPSVGFKVALDRSGTEEMVASGDGVGDDNDGKGVDYGPWMLVERKSRRGKRDSRASGDAKSGKDSLRSRFAPLMVDGGSGGDVNGVNGGILSEKENSCAVNRVLSKEDSGLLVDLGRGTEGMFNKLARPIVGSRESGSNFVGLSLFRGDKISKSLGKKPVGSDGLIQKDKDQSNKLPNSNSISFLPSASSMRLLGGEAQISGKMDF
ncbi:hypothetical protein PVK06_027374 [Gossypium arboreum]|uniref:CCHC-type domain-containing protein n=1 Tax=Gossypium arboreum TaxID=29729 RepID=A0ABR0P052_GOSAR|nr:hypothetical protein PVK06_027374 [Gossypium arboreum]